MVAVWTMMRPLFWPRVANPLLVELLIMSIPGTLAFMCSQPAARAWPEAPAPRVAVSARSCQDELVFPLPPAPCLALHDTLTQDAEAAYALALAWRDGTWRAGTNDGLRQRGEADDQG